MTCRDITRWLEENSKSCTEAGISPEQAVALCRWKLSDKVDMAVASCLFSDDPVAAFEDMLPVWPL